MCSSVLPHGMDWLPLDGFLRNFILDYFSRICCENSSFIKNLTRITGTLLRDLCTFMMVSRTLLGMRSISDKNCIENQNTRFNNFFFPKSCHLQDDAEKYGTARQATDDNTALSNCIPDNLGYKHTLRMCNTYCFSTTTMVM